MPTLTLALKKEYFDQIKAGEKTEEYRLHNAYWVKRLMGGKLFDKIVLTLGYPAADDNDRDNVMAHLGYYNSGHSNIAVPCSVVDELTVMTTADDMIDRPDGPAVLNTPAKWCKLIAAVIQRPQYKMEPSALY